jgi:hypothetical protein
MTWLVFLLAWAALVFVMTFDPVLIALILGGIAAVRWWFVQCRG